ncbi:hypothetical protein T492DRAFT_832301 [Pavlovales sp. CCMP2436]|nr:hypothetical protein T492DRAFT_832301 [Pavlovales sp. CCMP2436]
MAKVKCAAQESAPAQEHRRGRHMEATPPAQAPHLPLKRYWQLELWQDFFSQVIHVHHELPCPELCNIRASFEAHLSQKQKQKKQAEPLAGRKKKLPPSMTLYVYKLALGAVAADLGAAPADLEQTWCVPFDVVQETLVEVAKQI